MSYFTQKNIPVPQLDDSKAKIINDLRKYQEHR